MNDKQIQITLATTYFVKEIMRAALFRKKLEMPNATNKLDWIIRVECALEPENLSCDGEISGTELINKTKMLQAARSYLDTL